ncbi:MAG: hypothetical protein IPN36_05890 [Bacteroidetes bacterium]|nr:hypothetical protein [Bacteroidota bacterium]
MGTGLKCQGIIFKTFTDTINNRFYAGGYFNAIENIDASGIAMGWHQLEPLGSGIEGAVFDIEFLIMNFMWLAISLLPEESL